MTFINLQYIDAAQETAAFKTLFVTSTMFRVDKRGFGRGRRARGLLRYGRRRLKLGNGYGRDGTRSVEMVPERTWLPRFEAEDDERDGQLCVSQGWKHTERLRTSMATATIRYDPHGVDPA